MQYDVKDFQSEVIERSRTLPVLVDFWAEWCGPCKILGPVLERLAARNRDSWVLAKVDTENLPDIARQYGIRSIPNVKLFIDGRVVDEFVGALPEETITRWLKQAWRAKKHPAGEQARSLLGNLKFSEAKQLLDPIVDAEPDNTRARALLAKATFFSDPERAFQLVKDMEPGDEEHELADAISVFHALASKATGDSLPAGPARQHFAEGAGALLRGDYDAALEKFISVIREDRYYDDDGARKACIAIFKFLGEEHPITLSRRREFNSALFR